MKVEKNKHDHKLTNWLKVGIFAILMLAPILASMSQMLYATFNKNAYKSWTGDTYKVLQPIYYESNEVNSYDDILVGNIYYYTNDYEGTSEATTWRIYLDISMLKNQMPSLTNIDIDTAFMYTSSGVMRIRYDTTQQQATFLDISATPMYIIPTAVSNMNTMNSYTISKIVYTENKIVKEYVEVTEDKTLDNSFYYGVDKMTQSDLFNWTQNTALYTGIKAMTDNLQIQTNVIAILLTYWSILTIVYVIIDIVLKGFTFLTHMIVRSD